MKTDLGKELRVARAAARAGAAVLMRKRGRIPRARQTGWRNFVTEADLSAERAIFSRIRKAFPDHRTFGEESGRSEGDSPWCWVVDPLDGTNNYIHGLPLFCVSVALTYRGEPVVGVVDCPALGERYEAVKGKGATLDGRPIRARSPDSRNSIACTGFYYDKGDRLRMNVRAIGDVLKSLHDIRRTGSAALDLCWTAAGRFDGYWEFSIKWWDVAAGLLLVREAGGRSEYRTCRFRGTDVPYALAGHRKMYPKLRKILSRHVKLPR